MNKAWTNLNFSLKQQAKIIPMWHLQGNTITLTKLHNACTSNIMDYCSRYMHSHSNFKYVNSCFINSIFITCFVYLSVHILLPGFIRKAESIFFCTGLISSMATRAMARRTMKKVNNPR